MKRKAAEADKPEKKLRWDVPKTASLINFYKEHPELWNPRVPEYSNDKLRLKAVEDWLVENQLDPDKDLINEVKLKLHGLRTSYGHELKMEANKKVDGHPYLSKWQWYRQLSFLKEAMCFRSRSGSMSSTANGRRITRRRGRRGQQEMIIPDELDHNHNDSFYQSEPDVKIMTLENNGGPPHHGYAPAIMETEYEHPQPPQAHQQHHHSHHQHPALVHMGVHPDEAHHHMSPGAPPEHNHIQETSPHVPVVTYRSSREPIPLPVAPPGTSTITRNDSATNLNLMCLAAASNTTPTPDKQQLMGGAITEDGQRPGIPSTCCGCKCSKSPQTTGEKLGRLVEETFSNLHSEYHDLAKWEIQQVLGKYLQKPLP